MLTRLYDDEQRAVCYEVTGNRSVKVDGKTRELECRKFTDKGIIFENREVAEMNQLVMGNVAAVVENGIDTAQYSYQPKFEFDIQSRGGGGLSKFDCGFDAQKVQYSRHRKEGYVEMLYVHWADCMRSYIGTEWQDMITPDGSGEGLLDPETMVTDDIIAAARRSKSIAVNYNDVVGIFGGPNKKANSYDGVLAQAYWAFTQNAYFMSNQYTVDDTTFVDGTFLHAKYAGVHTSIDLELDSTQPSDPSLNRYQTVAEAMVALAQFLNTEAIKTNGKRYVDAVASGNSVVVTSRYAEMLVDLDMFVSTDPIVENWLNCGEYTGVSLEIIRNNMPVDERPFLVNYQKYTFDNILTALPNDIFRATSDIDEELIMDNQEMYLVIDPDLLNNYKHALEMRTNQATSFNLMDKFEGRIIAHKALANEGLWFVTAGSTQEDARNIACLVDVQGEGNVFLVPESNRPDGKIEFGHETYHGVMVRDFRLFAANLLCSPFVSRLKEPYEKTVKLLPCYNRRVREVFDETPDRLANCKIDANFVIEAEYQNEAKYELDGVIYTLEDGQTRPAGALPVYEIQLKDTSIGIPAGEVATYSYEVIAEDGTTVVYTDKNPIIQFSASASGITFNVRQTVTVGDCSSFFVASDNYEVDYPFTMVGACGEINASLLGTIFRTPNYTLASGFTFASDINVFVSGVADTIDMSTATDLASAVDLVKGYLDANGYPGEVAGTAGDMVITGSSLVVFVDNAAAEAFDNPKLVTIEDQTAWDEFDGLASFEGSVYCVAGTPPASPQFTELPDAEAIADCGGTFYANGQIQSNLGCTLDLPEVSATFTGGEYFVNFTLVD